MRWLVVAAALGCPTIGCESLRDKETFAPDSAFDTPQQYRTPDKYNEQFGLSNRARQIERSCGVGTE